MKKFLALALALVMVLSLSACGMFGPKAPKTASELVERTAKLEDADSFNVEGDIDLDMSIAVMGLSMDIPIGINMDFDVYDGNTHGTMKLSGEMFGESLDSKVEMYTTGKTTYTKSDDGQWVKSSAKDAKVDMGSLSDKLTAAELFKDAEMTYDKDTKTYTVTMKASALLENDAVEELLSGMDMGELMAASDDDMTKEMLEAFGDGDVTYIFDDTYHVTSVTLKNMSFEGDMSGDDSSLSGTMSVDMKAKFTFSDYGKIDEDDVAVPKSVKNNAVDASDVEDPDFPEIGFPYEDEPIIAPIDDPIGEPDIDVELPSVAENEPVVGRTPYDGTDYLGAYRGTPLTPGFSAAIFNGEFQNVNDEGDYNFVVFRSVLNKWCGLYLYDYNKTGLTANLADGVFGYSLECDIDGDPATYPEFTFNGLTWGASRADVIAAYGKPDYEYSSDDSGYWSVTYDVDMLGEDYDLQITGYEKTGVHEVELNHYVW